MLPYHLPICLATATMGGRVANGIHLSHMGSRIYLGGSVNAIALHPWSKVKVFALACIMETDT